MPKFLPCLWFDDDVTAVAKFYTTVFNEGNIEETTYYVDDEHKPKGSVLTTQFTLANQTFIALNGGPDFQFTPAISFFVDCETQAELDTLWQQLLVDGKELMPVASYPFSERFGWLEDRYGVSWQFSLTKKARSITPAFMFANQKYGQAETAAETWMALFGEGKKGAFARNEDGTLAQLQFTLHGQPFIVMDSPGEHAFDFTMATSFYVYCEDQAEIDRVWSEGTKQGKEWPCGWMEDQFGVCWQIVAREIDHYLNTGTEQQKFEVMQELYTMKKIDIQRLKTVYDKYQQ